MGKFGNKFMDVLHLLNTYTTHSNVHIIDYSPIFVTRLYKHT